LTTSCRTTQHNGALITRHLVLDNELPHNTTQRRTHHQTFGSWRAAAQHNTTAHSSPDIYITNDKYSAFHYFKPQPRFRNSYLAGSRDGFVENFFLGYRIICLVKLTASTMLYSIKRQYSSVPPLLRHCLPVLMKFVELQRKLYFFSSGWHW